MLKILSVTTISNTTNTFLIPHIKMLIEKGHQVDLAFNVVQEVNPEIITMGCAVHNIEFQRSPFSRKNIEAIKKIKSLILSNEYDLIHTHTPTASAVVRLACRNIDSVKVVYTAHGFHFYKGAPIQNWLIYYPIEKILSKYTDLLITINKEDYKQAKKFNANKVVHINGIGLNTNLIKEKVVNKFEKRTELGISNNALLLLSVGELNKNKNHEIVIRAIAQINNKNVQYLICGQGPLNSHLQLVINELNLNEQVKLLGFRHDVIEICKASDIFVFPSFREGLPVSIMEAMACGLPVICSNIRGNTDIVVDSKGGYLFNPNNISELISVLNQLINDSTKLEQYGEYNIEHVAKYDIERIIEQMKIYYELEDENSGT